MVSGIYDAITVSEVQEIALHRVTTDQTWNHDGSVDVAVTIFHDANVSSKNLSQFR